MIRLPILTIDDVVERQLCTGCGACAAVEPGRFEMDDAHDVGRRPFTLANPTPESGAGLRVCPGASLHHTFDQNDPELVAELAPTWGPVYEVWEGYATDPQIRLAGSSGGAATALALFAIEQAGMSGVLHTASDPDAPYLNKTVYSASRDELLDRTGSRYAPASPCEKLGELPLKPSPSVFIGKPCDVAAAQRARRESAEIDNAIGITIAFFCAGVPSSKGNLELLRQAGVEDPATITELRYRGNGWPGNWVAKWTDDDGEHKEASMTYEESWGFLQRYRQWRCYICPDHTGEFADIAVGDPWYRPVQPGEHGKSLIIPRTKRGLDMVHAAARAGYLTLETKDPSLLPRSQPNLLKTRGGLWGRLLVLRCFRAGVPRFTGFSLFRHWLTELSLIEKIQSITGTAKRVFRKKLNTRLRVSRTPAHDRGHSGR